MWKPRTKESLQKQQFLIFGISSANTGTAFTESEHLRRKSEEEL